MGPIGVLHDVQGKELRDETVQLFRSDRGRNEEHVHLDVVAHGLRLEVAPREVALSERGRERREDLVRVGLAAGERDAEGRLSMTTVRRNPIDEVRDRTKEGVREKNDQRPDHGLVVERRARGRADGGRRPKGGRRVDASDVDAATRGWKTTRIWIM